MSSELLVMRHAKSDWSAQYVLDHDRPLASRGIKAAKRMGRFLTAVGHAPCLTLASSAVRARTTAELAAEAGCWECTIEARGELYATTATEIVKLVREEAEATDGTLLIVGHEPNCSELIQLLTGAAVRMPTAATARLSLLGKKWHITAGGCADLRWLVTPKIAKAFG